MTDSSEAIERARVDSNPTKEDLDLSGISADEALERLMAGNERFLQNALRSAAGSRETFGDLSQGQRPYATIIGCSDSRVPPELIFDVGLGEVFVVRLAGNIFSPGVAASLQFAGSYLKTPLFLVLGHEDCGAVTAALESRDLGKPQLSRIQLLVDRIAPGLPDTDPQLSSEARLARAVESNVHWTVHQILDSPEGRTFAAEGWLKVVGAMYDIASGRVRLI